MADIMQGGLLEPTITTSQSQTTTPEFYTNYLQDIANLGQNAVTQGGVAGFSPLQQQAFNMAPDVAFAGATSTGSAQDLLTQSGYTGAPQIAQAYMNPFTRYMTDEMQRLTNRGVTENVMPNLDAAAISSGNYGSSRMGTVRGQSLRDIQADLAGKQLGVLGDQYNKSIQAAQADLGRGLQAGQALGTLGGQQQTLGRGGLDILSTLGAQQQKQAQTQLDYPMQQASNFSKLLSGQAIPTGSYSQSINPGTQGQFASSPLANVTTIAALLQALSNPQATGKDIAAVLPSSNTTVLAGKAEGGSIYRDEMDGGEYFYYGEDGNLYDSNNNVVE